MVLLIMRGFGDMKIKERIEEIDRNKNGKEMKGTDMEEITITFLQWVEIILEVTLMVGGLAMIQGITLGGIILQMIILGLGGITMMERNITRMQENMIMVKITTLGWGIFIQKNKGIINKPGNHHHMKRGLLGSTVFCESFWNNLT